MRDVVLHLCRDAERAFEAADHGDHRLLPERPIPRPSSPLPLHRRHLHARNPARDDALELAEVRGDVEGKAVPRDPLLHMDPDARDLAPPPRPDAGVARVPLGGNAELRECGDERVFEGAEIPVEVLPVAAQVDDRITDQLPGPVERDVAAALDLEHVDAFRVQQVRRPGGAAQRDHGRVLEQQEQVLRQATVDPRLGKRTLPVERLTVGDATGLDHLHAAFGHSPSLNASSRLPRTDQALPAAPSTKLATPHTASPGMPSRWSIGQARKATSSAPTADRTPITPRCHRLSSQRLRCQPNVAPTARPASVPARTGSAALSCALEGFTWCSSVRTMTSAATMVPPPNPVPHARPPRPIARGSFTCPPRGRANRARPGLPPRTWWGARGSRARLPPPCIRSPAPPPARG